MWGDPVVTPNATPALIIDRAPGPPFADRLDRLACKIALGFIAARATAEIALDPRLDDLRACALEGRRTDATHQALRLPEGSDTVLLPRVGRYFPFRLSDSGNTRDYAEIHCRADVGEATADLFPNAAALTDLFHMIGFLRNNERGAVRIILFGLFEIDVDIPLDLDVPWEQRA